METLKIEILDPKAKKLLENLMELKLIKISSANFSKDKFFELLDETRQDDVPSLEEIQREVKIVRKKMSARK